MRLMTTVNQDTAAAMSVGDMFEVIAIHGASQGYQALRGLTLERVRPEDLGLSALRESVEQIVDPEVLSRLLRDAYKTGHRDGYRQAEREAMEGER